MENLKYDIDRQVAHRLIAKALEHGARIILMERLEGYRPTTSLTRRENRRLRTMALRGTLKELGKTRTAGGNWIGVDRASLYGISVREVIQAYTSKSCSVCGAPGVRYAEIPARWFRDREGQPVDFRTFRGVNIAAHQQGDVLLDRGGPLFCCSNPECAVVKVHADRNAASNLIRQFASGKGQALLTPPKADAERRQYWQAAETAAATKLASRGRKLVGR